MKSVNRAKLDLIIAVTAFGTIGIFCPLYQPALLRHCLCPRCGGRSVPAALVVSPPDTLSVGKRPAALETAGSFRRDHQLQLDHAV